ncbi:hypothetical protein UFOVP62_7 [uncultured Caudovirales phage]|uniref:Uncharacterized protein n=1 Tax=uncultured Caudovirales phage TaxID=2100421 RepID=A0A6J5KUB8_9CAUD|nr:hypothetical protein UFOVP62_7 [uncultured Caudovirales phage]
MANRYYVNTGTTGNWSDTARWSLTSGGAGGQSVPTSADNVYIDNGSGGFSSIINLDVTANCATLNINTTTSFTGSIQWNTNVINVSGSAAAVAIVGTSTVMLGTPVINLTYAGSSTIEVSMGSQTETNCISLNYVGASTGVAKFSGNIKNLTFSGYAGTIDSIFNPVLFGDLVLNTAGNYSTATFTMISTSATARTITSNGETIGAINFGGVGGTFKPADTITVLGRTGLTSGTLDLNGLVYTTGTFDASGSTARTIAFGTTYITCTGSGSSLWTTATATNLTVTGTPLVKISNNSATASTVLPGAATEAQAISFQFTTGTYALTFLGTSTHTAKSVDFTGFGGTWGARAAGAIIFGDLTLSPTVGFAVTASANALTFGSTSVTARVLTSNGITFDSPITVDGVGGTLQLADALTMGATRTFTLTNGTLNLNNKTLSTGLFNSNGATARTIAFGTGNITCTGSGTSLWTTATTTNLTVTGTPTVNISNNSATASTVASGILTAAQAISFKFTTGTYALTFLATASYSAKDVDFTGFGGTWVARTTANTIYGSLTLSAAAGFSAGTSSGVLTFGATSGTQVITSNGKTFDGPVTVDGVGGTTQLFDALTLGSTQTFTLTNGALDLNSNVLTAGFLSSSSSNVRSIAFGATGNITCVGAGGTLVNFATNTNLTTSGTQLIKVSYSGATGVTISTGVLSEANAISYSFTTGSYALTFLNSSNQTVRNVDFTGFTGSWATRATTNYVIYGNLTLAASPMTVPAGTGTLNLSGTTGTQVITSNGTTIDASVIMNGVGGTVQLADAMTMAATRTFTLTNGTLNLNDKLLTAGLFSSTNANARTIAFGTSGSFRLIAAGGTLWNTGTNTYFAYTGTSNVTIDNSGAVATTLTPGTLTEAQALNFNIVSGTYALTITNTAAFRNLNLIANPLVAQTGFAGTFNGHTADIGIYGNLAISSNILSLASSTLGFVFKATSGTQILTSNGKTFDMPMAHNGSITGTLKLADALAMGSTRTFNFNNGTFDGNGQTITGALALSASLAGTVAIKNMNTSIVFNHTSSSLTAVGPNTTGKLTTIAGTLDLNGYTWTAPSFGTGVGTKTLTFNGGTLLLTGATTTTMDNGNPTGFTTVAGSATGYIRMNASSAKTFSGNGSTFNCILSNDGAGALTITGFNTFLGITNGYRPTSFVFPSGTTAPNITTITSSFTVSGTAGNLVTINSSTSGTAATLSMPSGGSTASDYLSLKDMAATGGAIWYAGPSPSHTIDVSGNTGWTFTAAPTGGTVLYFGITEPQDTSAVGVTAQTSAALAAVDPPDTSAATATSKTFATLAAVEAQDAAAVVSTATTLADLAATEALDTVALLSTATTRADFAAIEVQDTAFGATTAITVATIGTSEGQDSASLGVFAFTTTTLAATEEQDLVPIIAAATTVGSLTSTDAQDTSSVAATAKTTVLLAATEAQDTFAFAVSANYPYVAVILAATEGQDTAALAASVASTLALAASDGQDTTACIVDVSVGLSLAATDAPDIAVAAARVLNDASASTTSASSSVATCERLLVASSTISVVSMATVSAGVTRVTGAATISFSTASATGPMLWEKVPAPTGNWVTEPVATGTWTPRTVASQTWTEL